MSDENAGTPEEGTEAPDTGAEAQAKGTQAAPDEVTTLRSRNAGLDAKVTELQKAQKAAAKERDEALAKLADYEAGKVGADEALRAQLAAKEAELATARQEALLARIAAQYPETYAVLGEAAANLTTDKLAEAEARFQGVSDEPTAAAKPVPNNPGRSTGTEPESLEDARQKVLTTSNPWG